MTKPRDLKPGDTFVVPQGPYRGHKVEVLSNPEPGIGGTLNLQARVLTVVRINLDYAQEVE